MENKHDSDVSMMVDIVRKLPEMNAEETTLMLYEVAKIDPSVFVHAYHRSGIDSKSLDLELALMASSGDTLIPCIKKYREVTRCGLREAKEYVESLNLFGRN